MRDALADAHTDTRFAPRRHSPGLDQRAHIGRILGATPSQTGTSITTGSQQNAVQQASCKSTPQPLWKFTSKAQVRLTLANVLRQDYSNESSYTDANVNLRRADTFPSSMHVRANPEVKF